MKLPIHAFVFSQARTIAAALRPGLGAVLLGFGLVFGTTGCDPQDTATEPGTNAAGTNAVVTPADGTVDTAWEGATVAEIVDNPTIYAGRTVVVSGEVNRILSPRAFTLGGQGWFGGQELLVVTQAPIPAVVNRPADAALVEDDIVQVTGTVRNFVLAEIERELTIDLDEGLFVEFDNRPALIARDVDVTPRALGAPRVTGETATTGMTAPPPPGPPATTAP